MRDWQETTLDQAVQINPPVKISTGTNAPFVDMKQVEPGHKFVRAAEWRTYTGGGSKFISGDTLMARITPCLENGKIGQYRSDDGLATNGSTEFIVFRGKPGSTDNEFTYYLITSPDVRNFSIGQMTGTSGRQRVPTDCFKKYLVSLPPLPEQRAIAAILGSLDNKIKLNRQMNTTLEAMARALFKSWFVDFDPVCTKIEGKQPFGIDAATAALFPSRLVSSPLGDIPEDWKITPVIESGEFINGAAYKNMHFSNAPDALPVIKIAELKNGISPTTQYTNTDLGSKFGLDTGDILFSWSGSPDTSIDTFIWTGGPAWLNQHIFKVVNANKEKRCFTYWLLKYLNPTFIEIARDKQTTGLGHVTRADMQRIKFAEPSEEIMSAFYQKAGPIMGKIQANMSQGEKLARTRDYLLPKLISGDIRIPDAEKFLEAA
jgi:type I restriction enzyme, S subunit